MAKEKSIRLIMDEEDYKFISDYKEAFGVSINHFINKSIKERIVKVKALLDLDEIEFLDKIK